MFIKYIQESVWMMETVIQLCPEVQNNYLLQNYDFPREKIKGRIELHSIPTEPHRDRFK